jgi:hypothetical protein
MSIRSNGSLLYCADDEGRETQKRLFSSENINDVIFNKKDIKLKKKNAKNGIIQCL